MFKKNFLTIIIIINIYILGFLFLYPIGLYLFDLPKKLLCTLSWGCINNHKKLLHYYADKYILPIYVWMIIFIIILLINFLWKNKKIFYLDKK